MIEHEFNGIYRGKVVAIDTAEDDKLGRIKVEVYPMLICNDAAQGSAPLLRAEDVDIEGIEITELPWAMPAMPLFSGSGDGFGTFVIPKIGTSVWVFFEGGDVYQPVYFAEAPTKLAGLPVSRLINYPDRKVIRTPLGIEVVVDDVSGEVSVTTFGNVNVTTTSDVNVTATGTVNITGGFVNINPE